MSLTIILVIVFVALAIIFFLWILKAMLESSCPLCRTEFDKDEVIIPVVPGFLWWCPSCGELSRQGDLVPRREDS